jgi:hypothetical protein
VVLSEEDYQRNLNEVIQRQFFPDLVDLQTAATLQQRREAGDVAGAVAIRRAARQIRQHDEYLQEREHEQDSRQTSLRSEPRPLHLETLTGFHARVTSEDNADFEQMQSEEVKQALIDRSQMLLLTHFDSRNRHNNPQPQHLPPGDDQSSMLLASDAFRAPPSSIRPPDAKKEEDAAATALVENNLFFIPLSKENSGDDQQEHSNRLLMPPPPASGLISNQPLLAAPSSSSLSISIPLPPAALVEYIPKHQIEKRIEPANTRFPAPYPLLSSPPPFGTHLEMSDTDGTSSSVGASTPSDADTDLDHDSVDASSSRLGYLRQQGQKRRARELQTIVPDDPPVLPDDSSSVGRWKNPHQNEDEEGERRRRRPPPPIPATTPSVAVFRLPPTSSREIAAERAHEILQERSRTANRSKSINLHLSSDTAMGPAALLSTRSVSSSRRAAADGSVGSHSTLGRALRAAYGGDGGSSAASSVRSGSSRLSRSGGSALLSRPGKHVVVVRQRRSHHDAGTSK